MRSASRRAGLTLVELLTASLLAGFVVMGLVRLLNLTLDMWSRSEVRRDGLERSHSVLELLAGDLRALHGGGSGDLLLDWRPWDTNVDGIADRTFPRLRLVRQIDAAALQGLLLRDAAAEGDDGLAQDQAIPEATALAEVAWVVVPSAGSGESRTQGTLMRGERLLGDATRDSLLGPDLFGPDGRPLAGLVDEVASGVLWLGIECATQTTVLADGWSVGRELRDATTAWDAWGLGRPDPEVHARNEEGRGMPSVGDRPLLPRRVRLVLELERPSDLKRRTTLLEAAPANASALQVDDETRLPPAGSHVLIAGEWMEVLGVDPGRLRVRRGVRETLARELPAGALIHYGARAVTEVPIPLHQDDWRIPR